MTCVPQPSRERTSLIMIKRTMVFVPVFNQVHELPIVLGEIQESRLTDVDFLLINNGSSDGSEDIVRRSGHRYIEVPVNRGIGHSYLLALDAALEDGYEIVRNNGIERENARPRASPIVGATREPFGRLRHWQSVHAWRIKP